MFCLNSAFLIIVRVSIQTGNGESTNSGSIVFNFFNVPYHGGIVRSFKKFSV